MGRIRNLIAACEATGSAGPLTAAAREFRSSLELLAKLTGELDERPTTVVNVLSSPEVAGLITALLGALAPFPDARVAAAAVLDVPSRELTA